MTRGRGLRILMFSTYFPPQYSGAAKQAVSLGKELRARGHRVEFVTVRWPGLSERDEHQGFPVHRLEAGRARKHREFRLWWNLARLLARRRGDFDLVHSHGAYYTNCAVGPLARCLGLRSVAKASLADDDLHGIGRSLAGRLHRAFLTKIDACVAISRDLEAEFLAAGVARSRVHYLPNGVDADRFRPALPEERAELRRALGLPEGRPVALTVGVFDRRKNIGWLMEQWARGDAFGTGALLLAVGPQAREDVDGSFLGSLRALAAGHPSILRVQEPVEDIERYYRAADFFVLPSHSEGLPNVVLEAMASGLACVATAVSGTRELVTDDETGWTYEPGSAEALGVAVRRAAASDAALLGARGRRRIEAAYSIGAVADQYERLYSDLLGRPKSTPARGNPPHA